MTQMQPLIERFEGLLSGFREGGGARAIAQHTVRNKKLLARDRLAHLMDNGEFTELFRFSGFEQEYGSIPSAGNINGKQVCFRQRNCLSSDGLYIVLCFPMQNNSDPFQNRMN